MLAVRESILRQFGKTLDDATIERVLRKGKADISDRYLTAIRETAAEYVVGIFRRLREHEYDPELMRLYVVGGGSCLVRSFGDYEPGRVIFNDDICATAKGYTKLIGGSIMELRKRIIALTLALSMAVSTVPISTMAEELSEEETVTGTAPSETTGTPTEDETSATEEQLLENTEEVTSETEGRL